MVRNVWGNYLSNFPDVVPKGEEVCRMDNVPGYLFL
jgi:hypothetical protein